jgi:hypothetical protein
MCLVLLPSPLGSHKSLRQLVSLLSAPVVAVAQAGSQPFVP